MTPTDSISSTAHPAIEALARGMVAGRDAGPCLDPRRVRDRIADLVRPSLDRAVERGESVEEHPYVWLWRNPDRALEVCRRAIEDLVIGPVVRGRGPTTDAAA